MRTHEISDKIKGVVGHWTSDIQTLKSNQEIIAIKFGAQKVFEGFELYLSGHSWYDENGLWYLDEEWLPKENYISLGRNSLQLDRLEILDIYEREIQNEITRESVVYKRLMVVVGLVDGDLKRLK